MRITTARLVFAATCTVTAAGISYIHYDQMYSRLELKRGIAFDEERQRKRRENLERQKYNEEVERAYRKAKAEQDKQA